MKILTSIIIGALFSPLAFGQNILLKNGQTVVTKAVRRSGDTIMATMALQATQPGGPTTGEFGYPVAQIAKIDFPRPYQLQTAADSIAGGKPDAALQQLQPILTYYGGFKDAPGSWWAEAELLQIRALLASGKKTEATQLADQLGRDASTPDVIAASRAYAAHAMAEQGSDGQALQILRGIQHDAQWSGAQALAALFEGEIHVKHEEWEPALLAILQVPVLYPDQSALMPAVRLWTARAYLGLRDLPRAKTALDDLTSKYAGTPEAADARDDLAKLDKLTKAMPAKKDDQASN